jgi:hypothetical protein
VIPASDHTPSSWHEYPNVVENTGIALEVELALNYIRCGNLRSRRVANFGIFPFPPIHKEQSLNTFSHHSHINNGTYQASGNESTVLSVGFAVSVSIEIGYTGDQRKSEGGCYRPL